MRRGAGGAGPLPLAVAAVLLLAWLLANPRTPDLAAQVYRVDQFGSSGFAVFDANWYAGHHLPGYSLLVPALGSLLGVRLLAVLAVLASTAIFVRLAVGVWGRDARWGAALFAVAAVGDVWIGRVAFAVGVTFALGAAFALARGHRLPAAVLAAVCAAASPVAGALLALGALSVAVARRGPATLAVLAAPAAAVVIALALLFPEGGFEPYPLRSFLATLVVIGAFLCALPPGQRLLRLGAVVYLVACVLSLVVHTPMGSNIERYAVLLAGPLLLCARRGRLTPVASAALGVIVVFVLWGPVRETSAVAGDESTSAAYYQPVKRFLASRSSGPVRVEVPLTRSHWEAALLAPSVPLARGWEKQLETRYDRVLLTPGLTPATYSSWLHAQAVAYVALPDTKLDPSSAQEGEVILRSRGFLRLVFTSAHWRIYAVRSATPLATGPGRLTAAGHETFALLASAAGTFTVRIHHTRYWSVTRGNACVASAPDGWTSVRVYSPGRVEVAARFSLSRALAAGGHCRRVVAVVPAPPPAPAPAAYSWLVRTVGAPPSVAAENAAAGTRAWRLPGPRQLIGGAAHGRVEGYVAAQAVAAGQEQTVYINAPGARTVEVQLFRMGWYRGSGGRLVLRSRPLPVRRQPRCTHRAQTGLTECRWYPTLTFAIPSALASGVYIAKLLASTGAESDCLFVVRSRVASRLVVEIPTATWEAYNAWGGDSLYPGGSKLVGATGTSQGVEVSYDRPYDSQTGAGQFFIREVAIVRFLERYGYPASYTTIESIDGDPAQVAGARALMDVGHSEYWSTADALAFARAHGRGASLIFLSSDTMAWRVRFAAATAASSASGRRDHRIIAYKEYAERDPNQGERSGMVPLGGAPLVGSAYDGCITPRVRQPGPPVYRFYGWAPSPALRPSWLFAGSGVSASTLIPGIVGYELDERTIASPPGTSLVGTGATATCSVAAEPSPTRGRVAETTLYTGRSGALVFATGTLGWLYGLSPVPQASPDAPKAPDPRVVAMTRKLLARALR
ncbi:MAG TPA: N,N-dimethylformamidase beta subunit family domain-containing protein [Solirubrobacteraceae bacterium]|nr:N,N-dimethylformamidase beta subunit family domain-containing protein [Solirubrobacteraceae bacterium]